MCRCEIRRNNVIQLRVGRPVGRPLLWLSGGRPSLWFLVTTSCPVVSWLDCPLSVHAHVLLVVGVCVRNRRQHDIVRRAFHVLSRILAAFHRPSLPLSYYPTNPLFSRRNVASVTYWQVKVVLVHKTGREFIPHCLYILQLFIPKIPH